MFTFSFKKNMLFLEKEPIQSDSCTPNPCGPNANCHDGICTCIDEYHGDPYAGCRPECLSSSDCPKNKACVRNKCKDPCPRTCGTNAHCAVVNHIPICTCLEGTTGSPFVTCTPIPVQGTLINHCINLIIIKTSLKLYYKI